MRLSEFKLVKNRARPDLCFSYEKYNANKTRKYSIFTMDGGKIYLASIITTNAYGKLVKTVFSANFSSVEDAVIAISNQEHLTTAST